MGGLSSLAPAAQLQTDKQSIMYEPVSGDLSALLVAPPAGFSTILQSQQHGCDPGRLELKRCSLEFNFTD